MMYSFKKKRQWIGRGLVFVFLIGIISSGLALSAPTPVFAVDPGGVTQVVADAAQGACVNPSPGAAPCVAKGVSETSKSLWDKIITPSLKMVAVKALIDFVSFASNRIAYEAAVYIANGGPGEGSMFYNKSVTDGFASFGKDVAGEAFASLDDITKTFGLGICVPPNPMIRLNLKLSIKQNYSPPKPRCDFDSVTSQWGQVVSDASALLSNDKGARDTFLFNKLSEGLKPGNNELGASIGFLQLTNEKAQKDAELKVAEQIGSISIGGFTNVKDLITGQTKTPAAIVAKQFDDQLKAAKGDENKIKPGDILANPDVWYGLLNMSVSTFTNTLTSQLFNRVYKGLFSPQPENADPFNTELVGGSNTDATKADLGGIFTATPVANLQFDLLGEFAQCPPDGTGNRGLNSCVIDVSVVSAISRGGGSGSLTVQEAIDQKVLNGDWPLISPKDQSANQDRLCYTYGFCYGNLVKLRKARIISIGWELAAEKNSLNNPKSLKEIVAGFNDCNAQGQIDASHPWCHLIDPNWVLKAPESQCRASVNGEIRVSAQAAGRQSVCADAPTCIGEDSSGKCVQGFGYCVQEKNIWRVKGDECPAQYATCLTFANTHSGKTASYLLNTVDNANCTKQNAGCLWNKTQKVADQAGVFQWFTGSTPYSVAATSNTLRYNGSNASSYSYQDRLYTTHGVKQCDAAQAGCTELNVKNGGLSLNLVQNGSFEKDEDKNGMPDGWRNTNTNAVPFTVDGDAVDGTKSAKANGGYFYQSIQASTGSFYTFSLYAKGTDAGQSINVSLYPKTATGTNIAFSGLSFGGDCLPAGGNHYEIVKNLTTANEWKRFTCTVTLPATAAQVEVDLYDLNAGAPKVQYDGVQLEAGEVASVSFQDGYSTASPTKSYLKVAPSYLGCKGLDSDPTECANYAPVCSALDVGCNLYAPKESGPSVSAIASALDACPNACVGYDSYRQEGTKYEPAKFPVHFIADKAGVCSANAIGCDGFTKLGTNGGETQEYYTNLRACLTPEMADGSSAKTSATYFTWEGSDNSGFQLKTWQLLQSDVSAAPCTKPSLESESSVKCVELAPPAVDTSCDAHTDIFTNPDCREFFDNAGDIHYRLFSKTVTVDASCTAYRKNTSTSADCAASGGFWTTQGFCRYFGLQKESKVCSASENGCREYTGGAGRNATTILNEVFESGTIGSFVATASATAQPSNESVSSGGHSVRVIAQSNDVGIQTIPDALSSSLAKGKVYTMQFWAKGTGQLSTGFVDSNGTKHNFVENMDLTNAWSVYAVGPMDTSGFATFDKDAKLFFTTKNNKEFFVDNITLTQTAENITRIKDSWVTPAVCDQSPNGAVSPQYYLGCKAYTDRKGKEESYYQFTRVCSEKAIGCSAYYNTYNSESAYAQVANARCVNVGNGTLLNGVPSTTNKPCEVNGVTYCTISAGQNYCVFSAKQAFSDPLPNDTGKKFAIVYGPETVVTPQDQSIFLVDNGNAQCNESFKGCREVGVPTFAQDLKTVTKFESRYVLDTPDDYKNILCENQALFCDEFSSTKDGNFYFKNPLDKTCEYKTSVTIGNKSFNGWFRSGKSEPCYWTDANSNNKFDPNTDSAYLISGDESQIWKNGDVGYDGWIGACDTSANRCTELIDATDTSPENHGKGKSYYVINNDKLLENSVTLTEKCEGKVGQKAGCALFDNTTISQRKYSSSASYVLSMHADLLINKPENSLVDPISCAQGGGVFNISKETAQKIGTPSATTVDVCARRCQYTVATGDVLLSPSAKVSGAVTNERSCLINSDCPTLKTKLGKSVTATCATTVDRVQDDANTVLKVNRDRTCAAWLACNSSRTTWDAGSNKYVQICDSINLCTQSGSQGDQSKCASWSSRNPVVMTEQYYSSRDVSWAGVDYSGYQIPHQLPVERFNQFNLNPKKWCEKKTTKSCETNANCADVGGDCVDAPSDYRLVNNAGPCSGADATSCTVGFCKKTGSACSSNANCGTDTENICVFGYCQQVSAVVCSADTDCASQSTAKTCDPVQKLCVDHLLSKPNIDWACSTVSDCKGGATQKCVTATTTAAGTCYQNRCLTDIRDIDGNGFAEPLEKDKSDNTQSCRGYPEFDSPFPQKVVASWKIPPADPSAFGAKIDFRPVSGQSSIVLPSERATPSQFVSGYDGSKVCSPVCDADGKNCVANDDCVCSYTKAVYAQGSETRYYSTNTKEGAVPSGICYGGQKEGASCFTDVECTVKTTEKDVPGNFKEIPGTCQRLTSTNTMFGWQGYCLEKDTSIQLNGSTAAKDQACLTWLPIDQLSGATDLYGKDMSAGYQIASNTYYCAQPGVAWDLYSTGNNDYACAETNDGNCNDEATEDAFNDDEPHKNIRCPKGYVAFMAPCGDAAPSGYCKQSGDDDYPYFCVPRVSYHTSGGLAGQACKFPKEDLSNSDPIPGFSAIRKTSVTRTSPLNVTLYFSDKDNWETARKFYSDCVVKGVTNETSLNNYLGVNSPSSVATHGDGDDGSYSYRGFNINAKSYAACQSVVQVGSTSLQSGAYSAAWTDRVWQNEKNTFAIKESDNSVNPNFGFTVASPTAVFGKTLELTAKSGNADPDPMRILMCGKAGDKFPKANGLCENPNDTISQNDARSYGNFVLFPPKYTITGQDTYCKNAGCSCSPNTGVADCNTQSGQPTVSCKVTKVTCVNGTENNKECSDDASSKKCDKGGGKCVGAGTCLGGTKNTQACSMDSDCEVNVCQTGLYLANNSVTFGEYCVDKDAVAGSSTVGGFDPSAARARLQQIFAQSYSLQDFNDGYQGLALLSANTAAKYGGYVSATAGTWLWNVRSTANWSPKPGASSPTPNPPIITSLGNCIGSSCAEKRANQFSVNGEDTGVIEGEGSKHVSVTFYVYANSNQMPLRNVVIDWGDDIQGLSSGNPWPNGHKSGSIDSKNFYKNHRGLDSSVNPPKEICSSGATEFGKAPEACSSSYVLFTNDYVCTSSDVAVLPACKIGVDSKTKSIVNSPCFEVDDKGDKYCVFQPRIHAKDNWGWCTGYCDANPAGGDTTNSCFDAECAIDLYPSSGLDSDADLDLKSSGKIVNPWTYFDGKIKIKPVQ